MPYCTYPLRFIYSQFTSYCIVSASCQHKTCLIRFCLITNLLLVTSLTFDSLISSSSPSLRFSSTSRPVYTSHYHFPTCPFNSFSIHVYCSPFLFHYFLVLSVPIRLPSILLRIRSCLRFSISHPQASFPSPSTSGPFHPIPFHNYSHNSLKIGRVRLLPGRTYSELPGRRIITFV